MPKNDKRTKPLNRYLSTVAVIVLCLPIFAPFFSVAYGQLEQAIEAGADPHYLYETENIMRISEFDSMSKSVTSEVEYNYVSHVFTVADVIFFSYNDGTSLALYDSSSTLIWNNGGSPLDKGGHAHVAVSQGVYTACGSEKFAVLTGDPITRYVVGYYAMDQNGYGTSTEFYTWVPRIYGHCSFIVFAYQDNTQVTVEDTDTGATISTFTLNKGEHWQIETLRSRWLHVTANHPVSALTCYDQGYFVPSASGRWSGTEFYTYVSNIQRWPEDLTIIAYNDGTSVTIKDSDTGTLVWSGTLDEGQAHVESYPSGADKFFTITSSKPVTVSVQPWVSMTSSYHQGAYVADSTGTMLGTDLIGSTLNGGYLYILAYKDGTNVVVYNSRTGAFVTSYSLDAGEYVQANPGNGLWRIMSNYHMSAYSGWGQWNAEFAPVEFREVTPVKVEASAERKCYAAEEDVTLKVTVTDADGNPLHPLRKENFKVSVDGNEVSIEGFERFSCIDYKLEIKAPNTGGTYSITVTATVATGKGSDTTEIKVYTVTGVSLTLGGNRLTDYKNSADTPIYYRGDSKIYPIFYIDIRVNGATLLEIRNNIWVFAEITDYKDVRDPVNKKATYDSVNGVFKAHWKSIPALYYPVGKYDVTGKVEDSNCKSLASSEKKHFYLIFKPPEGYEKYVTTGVSTYNQFDRRLWKPVLDEITGEISVESAAKKLLLFAHGIDDSYYGYWHMIMDETKSYEEKKDPTHEHGAYVGGNVPYSKDYAACSGIICPQLVCQFAYGGKDAWWDNMVDFINSDFDPEGKATYKRPTGVCDDYATLFVSNARSAGIPAKEVTGFFKQFAGHEWTEIFDGNEWVHCEPTWYQIDSLYDGVRILYDAPDVYTNERGFCGFQLFGYPSLPEHYRYKVEMTIEFDSDDYDYGDWVGVKITVKNIGDFDIKRDLHLRAIEKPSLFAPGSERLLVDTNIGTLKKESMLTTIELSYKLPDCHPNWLCEKLGDRFLIVELYYRGNEVTLPCFDEKPSDLTFFVKKRKIPGLCPEWNPQIMVNGSTIELSTMNSTSFCFDETTNESTETFVNPRNAPVTLEHRLRYYENYTRENWRVFNPDNNTHNYSLVTPLLGMGDAVYIPGYGSVTTNQTVNNSANYIAIYNTTIGTSGFVDIYTFSKNIILKDITIFSGVVEIIGMQNYTLASESGESYLAYLSTRSGSGKGFDEIHSNFAEEIVSNGNTLTQFSIEGEHEQISYHKVGDIIYVNVDISNNGVLTEAVNLNLAITEPYSMHTCMGVGEYVIYSSKEIVDIPARSEATVTFQYQIPDNLQIGKHRIIISNNVTKVSTIFIVQAPFNVTFDAPAAVTQTEEFYVITTIANALDISLSGINATIKLPNDFNTSESLTKNIGTLLSGESTVVSWLVNATDFEYGYAPITIYISSAEGINDIAATSLTVLRLPELKIFSIAPLEVHVKIPFRFTVNVTNQGDLSLQDVSVTLLLPDDVTATESLTVLIGDLAGGETKSFSWTVTSLLDDDFWITVNAVGIASTHRAHTTELINVVKPEIELDLTNPVEVILDQDFLVTAEIKNSGEFQATEVKASLTLPSELTTTDPIDVDIGNLLPGQTKVIEWTMKGVSPGYGEITVSVNSSSITRGIIVTCFDLSVETDKKTYLSGDSVIITTTTSNENPEVSYVSLVLEMVVEGPSVLETYSMPIDYISSLETRNFALTWSSSGKPFGEYVATARILEETMVISETSTSFTITTVDNIPPTTLLTIGDPKFIDPMNNIYVTSATSFTLTAEDNPDGSGVASINYRIYNDTYDSGWLIYLEPFYLTGLANGPYSIDYYSIDNAGNVEEVQSILIVVNATSLTYSGDTTGQYSDPVTIEAILIDMATQQSIEGKTIIFTIGSQTATATTDSLGVATAGIVLDQPEGTHTVSSTFSGDMEYFGCSTTRSFIIHREKAEPEYTGDTVVPTTAKSINLRATIFDSPDGYWGDLAKIQVTFSIYAGQLGSTPFMTILTVPVSRTDMPGVGVAVATIDILPENGYLIIVSIDSNDYYEGPTSDATPLTVYKPTGEFVTGGGWIWDSSGSKGNFGFNVKYTKFGKPKGQSIYVYRKDGWNYIVKSNAWIGLAINSEENHACFEAKCVIQKYNPETGELVWAEGNYKFRVDVWDNDGDGAVDIYQIRVLDKNGVVYHEAGFSPLFGYLQGGNIVIHDRRKPK